METNETKYLVIYRIETDATQYAIMSAEAIFSTMDMEDSYKDGIRIDVYKLERYGEEPVRCVFLGKGHDPKDPRKMMLIGPYGVLSIGYGTVR